MHLVLILLMEKDKKKTLFVRQPEYAGGMKALGQFVQSQLKYPEKAFTIGLEGTVIVDYDIDYQGNVVATRVLQGIGHGCDEEACRVIRLLKFDVERTRGLRVLYHKKTHVQFKLPKKVAVPAPLATEGNVQLTYTLTPAPAAQPEEAKPATTTYSYTIYTG